jgi:hypothetical protein
MPNLSAEYYSAVLALDALMLLILAIERRAHAEDMARTEYVWGEILVLSITADVAALVWGSNQVLAWISVVVTLIVIVGLSVAVQVITLGEVITDKGSGADVLTAMVPGVLMLAIVIVGFW